MRRTSRDLLERALTAFRLARQERRASTILALERIALEYLRQADRARRSELEKTPLKGI
jgi:hypothetical protein